MRKSNHRKSNISTETYVKTRKEKSRREGERFHYNNGYYTMVFSGVLKFLGSIDRPPSALERIYYLYKWYLLDKAVEFSFI